MKRLLVSLTTLALVAAASVFTAACSDDDHDHDHDHDGAKLASCEAFHDACVAKASTSAKAKECDDFTHVEGRTEAECAAKKDECVAACQ